MPDNIHELYHTDLFRAILENQARGHPILNVLLYIYCPIAVRWWLNGTDPTVPYDPVWDAMTEFSSGVTLKETLERRGFSDLIGVVKKYIDTVIAYQRIHPAEFPQPGEVFPGAEKALAPYGYQNETNRFFGGDIRNLERFVRTWVFIIPKWRADAFIPPGCRFGIEQLAFYIPGVKWKPVIWPAWSWVITTNPTRIIVGLLENDSNQHQLLFALAAYGVFHADKNRNPIAREPLPDLFSLDRSRYRAKPFHATTDPEKLVKLIPDLSKPIQEEYCFPIALLKDDGKCVTCGFRFCCYNADDSLSPTVIRSMTGDGMDLLPLEQNGPNHSDS